MVQLTKMQQRIYDYIAQTIRTQGYPPSVREIGDAVGLKSPSTVHFHLKHMEELGVIGKGAGKGRALTLTEPLPEENQIPIVGTVAAGTPILAEECIEDYLTFDAGGDSSQYFALRVRGESMLNAGILPDDLVVVRIAIIRFFVLGRVAELMFDDQTSIYKQNDGIVKRCTADAEVLLVGHQ